MFSPEIRFKSLKVYYTTLKYMYTVKVLFALGY